MNTPRRASERASEAVLLNERVGERAVGDGERESERFSSSAMHGATLWIKEYPPHRNLMGKMASVLVPSIQNRCIRQLHKLAIMLALQLLPLQR